MNWMVKWTTYIYFRIVGCFTGQIKLSLANFKSCSRMPFNEPETILLADNIYES